MPSPTHPELTWLAATALLTLLQFAPYVVARIVRIGLIPALANPQPDQDPSVGWSWRAAKAHKNHVEGLVTFAPLVLVVVHLELASALTATACAVYFFARLAHYVIYVLGVPVLRTLAFFVATCCQLALALRIFAMA